MDEIDQANIHAEFFQQQALRDHFAKAIGSHVPVSECIDCGMPIEKARLRIVPDAVRCVDCQRKKERKR